MGLRSARRLLMLVAIASFALTAGCGSAIQFASPFILAEEPPGLVRLPMKVAIVRPVGIIKARRQAGEDFRRALGDAMIEGLADATKVMVQRVVIVDAKDAVDCDLHVIPANLYYEVDKQGGVTLSMDVTLIRTKDAKESGMLVEGVAGSGKRHIEAWHRTGHTLNVMGAYLKNDRFGQALNNALFDLVFNYAKKLDRRMPGLIE
jgi:hypothetical protein